MMNVYKKVDRVGFTLVELVVVIGILGVLIGLLMPAIQAARESVRRLSCLNNQKQIVLALHLHESSHKSLPPTLETRNTAIKLLFWQATTLPYIEQNPLFEAVRREALNGRTGFSNPFRTTHISTFQCVSNPDHAQLVKPELAPIFAFTDYCGVAGADDDNGTFVLNIRRPGTRFSEITRGLSNNLAFGERPPSDFDEGFGAWIGGQLTWSASTYTNGIPPGIDEPRLLADCDSPDSFGFQQGKRGRQCDWSHHWSFHPGGANFARTDGSTSFLSYDIDRNVLANLASRN